MSRMVGTVSRGIRAPIIRSGDDLAEIVTRSVLEAAAAEPFSIRDRDVIAMTEAIVARAQGNYASVDDIAADVRAKLGGETIGVIFPILSRNRFAICLRGIAKGAKKVILQLSYPSDEVGNHLVDLDLLWGLGPTMKVHAMTVGTVEGEFQSQFSSAGVNQTLHKIDLELAVPLTLMLPGGAVEAVCETQIPIAETVIVGQVPQIFLQNGGF